MVSEKLYRNTLNTTTIIKNFINSFHFQKKSSFHIIYTEKNSLTCENVV